ncbi:MAG: hypothetical protein PHW95_00070 [Patescibacteria group bacterium]|nr:hypothetical protein [Patescibacteria group bacterium]
MSAIKPIISYKMPAVGGRVFHFRTEIRVTTDGQLQVGDKKDAKCVEFSRSYGCGASANCFAVKSGDRIKVFEGPTFGQGMISRTEVLAACC